MDPESRNYDIFNAFLQDDISFSDRRLHLTLGSKFEYNDFTHSEIQPNARLLWKPNDRHSLWAAVSRAVRTPSRVETASTALISVIPPPAMGPLPVAVKFSASEDFDAEKLTAYELGYRIQVSSELSFDTAFYFNDYKDLRQTVTGAPIFGPTYTTLPVTGTNETKGEIYGFELAADWKPTAWSRIQAAYTYMDIDMDSGVGSILREQDPNFQLSLRTSFDLPWDLELDFWYRHIGKVSDTIGAYDAFDARIGWHYNEHLELSIVGQNLFDSHHPEFEDEGLHYVSTEVERGFYGKATWTFD